MFLQNTTLWQEWCLFKYYWWRLFLSSAVAGYWCVVIARNLAYMRHFTISHYVKNESNSLVEIFRLDDIGIKLLPDRSNNESSKIVNEESSTG